MSASADSATQPSWRERQTVMLFCAAVILLFNLADWLALGGFRWPSFLVRVVWAGLVLVVAWRLPRLSPQAQRLSFIALGVVTSVAFGIIVSQTGGLESPLFHWILAMPILIAVVVQDHPSATAAAGVSTVASGLTLLALGGADGAWMAQWAVQAVAFCALAYYASVSYRRLRRRELEALRTRVQVENKRRLERAQQESQAQLAVILQGVSDAIAVLSADGSIRYANEAAAKGFGFPDAETMLAQSLGELAEKISVYDERGQPIDREALPNRRALRGEKPPSALVQTQLKGSGERRWLVVRSSPVFDPGGQVQLAVNIWRDVTEEVRQDETRRFISQATTVLAESLDYGTTLGKVTRLAADQVADVAALYLISDEGTLDRASLAHADDEKRPLAERLRARFDLQRDAREGPASVVKRGQTELASPLSAEQLAQLTEGDASGPQPPPGLRSAIYTPLRVRGHTLGVLCFFSSDARRYDAGDLARAEELAQRAAVAIENARLYREARQAVSLRDEFLTVASHELRTPLTSLKLYMQGLLRDFPRASPERLKGKLEIANHQVDRLAHLVGQMLDLSRITHGRLMIDPEDVELEALVGQVVERFSEESRRVGSEVHLRLEPMTGRWDRLRLDQLVTNLLQNALKYGNGRPIQITLERRAHEAVLHVRDEGIGIAAEQKDRIFEKFERAVPTRHYGGLGLGLYIARQIAEAMGGSIQVETELGKGSIFTVRLPLEPGLGASRS